MYIDNLRILLMGSGVRSMANLIAEYDNFVDKTQQDEKRRFKSFAKNRFLEEEGHDQYALYMNEVMERVEELEALRSWLLNYIELCRMSSQKEGNWTADDMYIEMRDAQRKLMVIERKLMRYNCALDAQED